MIASNYYESVRITIGVSSFFGINPRFCGGFLLPLNLCLIFFKQAGYRSEAELKDAVMHYVEFYNAERPHAALLNATPNRKEAIFFAKAE